MTGGISLALRSVPLIVALLAAPLAYGTTQLVARVTLRQYRRALTQNPELHWSEKARLSLAGRRASTMLLLIFPLSMSIGMPFSAGELSWAPGHFLAWIAGVGSFLGAYMSLRSTGRLLGFPQSSLLRDLRAFAFSAQALISVVAVIVCGRSLADTWLNPENSRLLLAACALPWAWPPFVLWFFSALGALHLSPQLERDLAPLFDASKARPRRLWVARISVANAIAYPAQKTIIVTERLLAILEAEELRAIVAHELGHLAEGSKAWIRYLFLVFLGFTGGISAFIDAEHYVGFLAAILILTIALLVVLQKWSRTREHEADTSALELALPTSYAKALEKVHAANLFPAVQRGGTHPSLYDRMERAGVTPDFPRPAPPSRRVSITLLAAVFAVTLWPTMWPLAFQNLATDRPVALAVTSHDPWALGELALRASQEDNLPEAIALYRRAEQLAPDSPWYARNLMAVLDMAGDCEEARAAAARAHEKAENDPAIKEFLDPPARCNNTQKLEPLGE